jgi:hypothetical protein
MATYTDTLGFDKGSAGGNARGNFKTTVREVLLDFAAITAARSAASATALANGDILEVIPVPAQTVVLAVGMEVLVAEGGTCTVDIGDGDDADGYLDGVDANAAAGTSYATSDGATGYAVGRYYSSADTIDFTMVNAMDTGVVRVWAVCVDVDGSVEYQS